MRATWYTCILIYTCTRVETGIIACVLRNIAIIMSTAESPMAVFEYPFKHRTIGPLKKLKILSKHCFNIL